MYASDRSNDVALRQIVPKEQRWFFITIGIFVILFSFLYGLISGLRRGPHDAFAAQMQAAGIDSGDSVTLPFPYLPQEILQGHGMGEAATVNGIPQDLVYFFSERSVEIILRESVKALEREGFKVSGVGTKSRGVVYAEHLPTLRRVLIHAWRVPAPLRKFSPDAAAVQGIFSLACIEPGLRENFSAGLSGIPRLPGGKVGSVIETENASRKETTAVYTNPGVVGESMQFYQQELLSQGFQEESSSEELKAGFESGHSVYRRNAEEISLILSRSLNHSLGKVESVVVVHHSQPLPHL